MDEPRRCLTSGEITLAQLDRQLGNPRAHHVRERRRHAVRGVARLGSSLETQEPREHELHLLLARSARSDHGLLDLGWRKLVNGEPGLLGGKEYDAARVPEYHGGPDILRVEHVLDRERGGPMAGNELGDAVEDLAEPSGQGITWSRANDAAFDQRCDAAVVASDDPVARVRGAWIDAEDDQTFAISETSMSKFAQTFCTSSSSSSDSISLRSVSASLPSTFTVDFGSIAISASCAATPFFSSALFTAWKSDGVVVTMYCSSSRRKSSAPTSSAASMSVSSSYFALST